MGVHRERSWTSFWAGTGLIEYHTQVTGSGKVVLATSGPVEDIALEDGRYWAQGDCVARTAGLTYRLRRPTKSYFRSFLNGDRLIRSYEGTGRLLVSTTPYWRLAMSTQRMGNAAAFASTS